MLSLRLRTAALAVALLALVLAWNLVPRLTEPLSGQTTTRTATPRKALDPDEQATVNLFEQAKRAVAYISTRQRVVDPWTRNVLSVPQGTGSGFVWDQQGHVVTNFHVVSGASDARVRLSDGREFGAVLVGISAAHDLAVLRIDGANRPQPLTIGTSGDLKVGQKVFAIGNPFGLDWTLTTGIVSALDRSLPAADGRSLIEHLIQTDAAINPGNSGGPLLDSAGRLIGVNTMIFSPSGAYAGVGFAVPIDTVGRVVPQIISQGKYVRPALGIDVDDDINRAVTTQLGVQGVAVLRAVQGGAAAAAGLRGVTVSGNGRVAPGDIIVAVNGVAIDGVQRLLARLDEYRVGETVRLTVLRDGKRIEIAATLQPGG